MSALMDRLAIGTARVLVTAVVLITRLGRC